MERLYNPVFDIAYECIKPLQKNQKLMLFKRSLTNNTYGLLMYTGEVLIEDGISPLSASVCESGNTTVLQYKDVRDNNTYIVRFTFNKNGYTYKVLYVGNKYTAERIMGKTVVLDDDENAVKRMIGLDGKTYNDKIYAHISYHKTYKEILAANMIKISPRKLAILTIDICDQYGNIKQEEVKWTDTLEDKYMVSQATLYTRMSVTIEIKNRNGHRECYLNNGLHFIA